MTVYFITSKGRADAPVKIGMTTDLDRRLAGIQTSHHEELEVVAAIEGGRETEQYLHESLSASHIRGEWFERTPEVEAAIARARSLGAPSLPLLDVGAVAKTRHLASDANEAQAYVRQLLSAIAPDEDLSTALALVCRRLNRSSVAMTIRRLRALYNGEPRRVDAFEMKALKGLVDQVNDQYQANDSLVLVPIIASYLNEVGTPLTPEQSEIVDRYLQRCSEALAVAGGAQ